jgi:hypothetical protein
MLSLITAKAQGIPAEKPTYGPLCRPSALKSALKQAWIYLENTLPDSLALRLIYYRALGEVLNLRHPRTFTEKIQWLKLHYRRPIMTRLADKYLSREYVEQKLGPHVLNELYGVWNTAEAIDFDSLPDQFALKVSSASHANIFCRDKSKLDDGATRKQLSDWMKHNYYTDTREWAYKDMTPRVIAERLLEDGTGQSPADYKFYCFNGRPELIEVDIGRHENLTITILDPQWCVLPCTYNHYPTQMKPIPQPENLQEMLSYAEKLSEGFPFARIDFYSIQGKTIFGEITWYPSTGLNPLQPPEFNHRFGDLLKLPPTSNRWQLSERAVANP